MRIVHVASEFAPLVKVGGLGDVVHGLAQEQVLQGHQVEIILPKYDILKFSNIQQLSLERQDLWSFEDASRYHNSIFSGMAHGIQLRFIEAHHPQYYFSRGRVYGAHDDIERFLYFSRTVGEYLHMRHHPVDIIHLHDWPTAALAPILHHIYRPLGFSYGKTVLTIHNIEHQGKCSPANLSRIGLRGDDFRTEERMIDPKEPHLLNLLKGGIIYADAVTTVSPTYKKEIMTPPLGFHLDGVMRKHASKCTGILNGIDSATWTPPYPTNATFIDAILQKKAACKTELFKTLGLKPTKAPLIACITRLTQQKGIPLILHAIHTHLKNNGAFILLGSSLDPAFSPAFDELEKMYASHPHFFMKLSFDQALAHETYAAADALLVPSLFEPCGLTQMIAMRHATLPIVRNTGGLADTVFDADNSAVPLTQRNGFTFENPDTASVERAVQRAVTCYLTQPQRWKTLLKSGLMQDHSWKKSAAEYVALYKSLLPHPSTQAA